MLVKIVAGFFVLVVLFLGYVATRPGQFSYERSGVIHASPERIFPFISQFKLGTQWSPYEKADPQMKHVYGGTDGTVGASEDFESDKSGSGRLEILNLVPNERVEIRLTMTKPFRAENFVVYKLTPERDGTRFSWSMSGDGGFVGKLVRTVIDCEKIVAGQFGEGIANLKALVESQTKEGSSMAAGTSRPYTLTEKPSIAVEAGTAYVYVEKKGSIPANARAAWQEAMKHMQEVAGQVKILGTMAMYKMKPEGVYRAGMKVDKRPAKMPEGMMYAEVPSARYAKFTMKGAYDNLPKASGQVWETVDKTKLDLRDDFAIEQYVNDPSKTPENDLVTEILVPVK